MAESNVSLLFQNTGTIYVINEEAQLGFRLFIDRDTGAIRRPEGNYLIYEVTEERELGERVQDVREASKSFDELREDGWELPWEDDLVVSFTQDEDNSIVINNGGDVSTFPDPLEDPITPTPEPVPTPEEPIPVNDSESIERTANLTGSFDLQFWGKTHKDLIDEKEYPGGNLSFTENSSFNVNTPVYNSTDAAYEDDYEVPSDDLLVSLGTLIYRNDKVDDDFGGSRANHGANFKLTLDEPVDAYFSSNFYLDIINRRESYETIKVGFRGPGPNKYKTLQLRSNDSGRGLPIFLDGVGKCVMLLGLK